jgi:hypothetical protein
MATGFATRIMRLSTSAAMAASPCWGSASGKATAAATQCCVVGHAQFLPEQPQHARGESLSLAQGEVEDEPQHQHQLARRVRVPRLAARCGSPWRLPPSDGGLVKPEGQVTTPLQASFVGQFRTR